MLIITIILGLILAWKTYNHFRFRLVKFEKGKFKITWHKDKNLLCISFYKWLYVSDVQEANRRLQEAEKNKENVQN